MNSAPVGLLEIHSFRCFNAIWDRVTAYVRHNQDRWDNESHFVRCAVLHYIKHLESEKVNFQTGRPKTKR